MWQIVNIILVNLVGDNIRHEVKNQAIGLLNAWVVIAGNYSIDYKDLTSGISRRRVLVEFNSISLYREKLLTLSNTGLLGGPLAAEVPSLVSYLINNKDEYIKFMNQFRPSHSNPVFSYFAENLIVDPKGSVAIGNYKSKSNEKSPLLYPLFLLTGKSPYPLTNDNPSPALGALGKVKLNIIGRRVRSPNLLAIFTLPCGGLWYNKQTRA